MICDSMCHECKFSTCIREEHEKATYRRYYEKNREKKLAYQKAYNDAHKEKRHEQSKSQWANMTEEQKEVKRARQREYCRRKKGIEVCQNK